MAISSTPNVPDREKNGDDALSPASPHSALTPRLTRSSARRSRPGTDSPAENGGPKPVDVKEEEGAEDAGDMAEKAPASRPKKNVRKASESSGGKSLPAKKKSKGGAKEPEKKPSPQPDSSGEVTDVSDLGEEEMEGSVKSRGEEKVEQKPSRKNLAPQKRKSDDRESSECRFVGEPVPESEAQKRWPDRYKKKSGKRRSITSGDDDEPIPASRHFRMADVDGERFNLFDDVYVKAEEDKPDYIGRIVEFFESTDNQLHFTAQWFFRAEDTVIGKCSNYHDERRLFLSTEKNDNLLDCIVSKINIVKIEARQKRIPTCDFYYDMAYSLPYTSFTNLSPGKKISGSESSSTISCDGANETLKEEANSDLHASLLDLYSGCGAMSTGLCQGAHLGGLKLETKWAVDLSPHACASLKLNHPNAQVRNENAEHFLALLKEWEKLCEKFRYFEPHDDVEDANHEDKSSNSEDNGSDEEFEVDKFLDICYGDPASCGTTGLKLKVRWKGYGPSEDSWEPIDGLWSCEERLNEFVKMGIKSNMLPLPGDVDVICGGPPCQGISGFNRFRNFQSPLEDVKNQQIIVYMDIVEHLKPKFVLMENVVDILKFSNGFLGRYAISRLIKMNYQTRLGIMAAGCYGLPQFRGRAFLWGAQPSQKLPPFPLPTHTVVVRGVIPNEFERNLVAYDEDQPLNLKDALYLTDAISDLPPVTNDEERDEMPYGSAPISELQRYIRLAKSEMMKLTDRTEQFHPVLFDHRPLKLNTDDYQRVQQIPIKKGANFRDLPGVRVRPDNVVELDPNMERVYLPSKKPLVPDYALTFVGGKSHKPFGRLWWDEIVPTVVTRAEPHNQAILHPNQARVLTIRENARIQGFPDHYQLCGPVKERYIQVGNAVAVPVARALGFALGQAFQNLGDDGPLMTLPKIFP